MRMAVLWRPHHFILCHCLLGAGHLLRYDRIDRQCLTFLYLLQIKFSFLFVNDVTRVYREKSASIARTEHLLGKLGKYQDNGKPEEDAGVL